MRIERGEHAVDRRLDQLLVADLLDIFRPDALEDLAEEVELPVGVHPVVGGGRLGLVGLGDRNRRRRQESDGQGGGHVAKLLHPRPLSRAWAKPSTGSIGWPLRRNSKYISEDRKSTRLNSSH